VVTLAEEADFKSIKETHAWQNNSESKKSAESTGLNLFPRQNSTNSPLFCPSCHGDRIWKDGLRRTRVGDVQRWLCRKCGFRFSESSCNCSEDSEGVQKVHRQILNRKFSTHSSCQVCVSEAEGMINLAEVETRTQEKAAGATTILDAKTEFAEQLRRDGYSPYTIKQCLHYLNLFQKKGVNTLHPEEVKAFIAEQKWQNHSKATAVTIYGIFAKAMHLQWTPPKYKYDQKIPFIPTEKEIDDLIAGTGNKTSTFLRVLKETGCRLGEALKLKWTDIDLAKNTIIINSPEKNSLPRILKVSLTLMSMLNTLPRENDFVFSSSKSTMESNFRMQRQRLARKLGNPRLKQIHLHTFRHFYATMLYAKTLNILKVQQALGHKNLMNTQIYTHLIDFESDEYDVQVSETLEEAKKLLEAGYDYVTDMDNRKLFRKRK